MERYLHPLVRYSDCGRCICSSDKQEILKSSPAFDTTKRCNDNSCLCVPGVAPWLPKVDMINICIKVDEKQANKWSINLIIFYYIQLQEGRRKYEGDWWTLQNKSGSVYFFSWLQ